uniref:F-box domain-containing protein n=1 Tax=Trichogramma kaykai TaxID=54128 RepID=A0ABD2XU29_9HYME
MQMRVRSEKAERVDETEVCRIFAHLFYTLRSRESCLLAFSRSTPVLPAYFCLSRNRRGRSKGTRYNSSTRENYASSASVRFMGSKALFTIVKRYCPQLTSIDITGLVSTREGIEFLAKNYKNVTNLAIGYCRENCEAAFSLLFENAQQLKSLRMKNVQISGSCFLNLPTNIVEELNLENLYVTSPVDFCQAFEKLESLRTVILRRDVILPKYLNQILVSMTQKSQLKSLIFDNYMMLDNPNYSFVGNLSSIETLEFRAPNMLNDYFLKLVACHCKNLKRAVFADSSEVSDLGFGKITSLPKLEYLEVRGMRNITDSTFPNMQSVQSFKCVSCCELKSAGIARLIESSRSLGFLEIRNCRMINGHELISSAVSALKTRNNDHILTICLEKKISEPRAYRVADNLLVIEEVMREYLSSDFDVFALT